MKKILRIFAFCVAFMSSGELVHAQVFVKTDAVKSVWSDYDFNEQGTTLESVIVFCMNKSGATISDCREKVKQIVANHNQIIKHDKSVQVPLSNEKSNLSGNEISQIIITRDLDGGTRVSGNCDSEIVVKYGTRVTLDCDAVKHGKNLTGYIDQDGHKMSKNSFFSYAEPGYTELTIPVTKSLTAEYGESETQERVIDNVHDNDRNLIELNNWETRAVQPAETLQHMDQPPVYYNGDGDKKNAEQESGDDLRQQRSDKRKEKIKHLRRNPDSEFTDIELKLYDNANVYAAVRARSYMALVQYRDASGKLKRGDRTKLRMYDCDVNANRCGFTFVGEKSGVNVLACCRVIGSNSATCEIPYTWKKGDTEHTSVSDCRG